MSCEVCDKPGRLRRTPDDEYVLCRDHWLEVQEKWARRDELRDEAMDMLAEMKRDDDE